MSGQPKERHLVIARLRDEIRRMEHRPARRDGTAACGIDAVDAVLPGGFPRGALSELAGGPASGKTAVALALFARLGPEELAAYVDGRAELYPPAASSLGVDLGRLLVVRPPRASSGEGRRDALSALWAAEALLSSGAFSAVAIDVALPRRLAGWEAIARRLQSAAERGGAVGLWLAPSRGGLRLPAAVRIELAAPGGRIVARRASGERSRAPGGSGRAA